MASESDVLPNVSSLPAWLVPSVYLNWTDDWLRESVAIATRSPEHRLPGGPDGPQRGDVVVTVVAAEPGIVAAVELMGASQGEAWVSDELFGPDRPVVWDTLFSGAAAYSRSSGWLPQEHARLVLDGIANQFKHGASGTIEPGECEESALSPNLHALRLLSHRLIAGWDLRREERCATCERFVDVSTLRVHDDGARRAALEGITERNLQQLISDTYLVCDPCHELLHPHAVAAQRARMRPQCPACGARGNTKRIVWGMNVGDVPLEPDVVYGGFDVPVPTPEWYCPECHANFATGAVASRALGDRPADLGAEAAWSAEL
ncbi:hypothetical protein L1785_11075 [Antribacter sp. KLBMP9083]|uniref:Uncharacterized protein n=1 Tax=Antribacter soli TaxID=2910976 RepID=A0AA41QE76_9MICO|nr:hypothetical protein [Antribacter soli]MCF4121523.1 hypothetical protein [Antribacter soli]